MLFKKFWRKFLEFFGIVYRRVEFHHGVEGTQKLEHYDTERVDVGSLVKGLEVGIDLLRGGVGLGAAVLRDVRLEVVADSLYIREVILREMDGPLEFFLLRPDRVSVQLRVIERELFRSVAYLDNIVALEETTDFLDESEVTYFDLLVGALQQNVVRLEISVD